MTAKIFLICCYAKFGVFVFCDQQDFSGSGCMCKYIIIDLEFGSVDRLVPNTKYLCTLRYKTATGAQLYIPSKFWRLPNDLTPIAH